ncbi:U32 family peptidase, partial [Candidatus Dojkabacteria bacterium]|nr:U32 family peptidase [Candidatus Dojkabacteria bacterium]
MDKKDSKGKIPKILAPAGSFETLQAALDAGADEVYFGIADFNMRATAAANFKREDLEEIVERCRTENVKTNMTVNTVLYDDELEKMRKIIDLAREEGVDSIIAADMATIVYAHSVGLEVHISTQVSISNVETVKFYSKYANRIVLARELNLEQVADIVEQIKKQKITGPSGNLIEIEIFAHGALCVAVSGRCAMSLYCSNTSANRGKCSHMCRRSYRVTDISTGKELIVDNNFVMSSADLCTIGMLPELVEAGVYILKIEGRGR